MNKKLANNTILSKLIDNIVEDKLVINRREAEKLAVTFWTANKSSLRRKLMLSVNRTLQQLTNNKNIKIVKFSSSYELQDSLGFYYSSFKAHSSSSAISMLRDCYDKTTVEEYDKMCKLTEQLVRIKQYINVIRSDSAKVDSNKFNITAYSILHSRDIPNLPKELSRFIDVAEPNIEDYVRYFAHSSIAVTDLAVRKELKYKSKLYIYLDFNWIDTVTVSVPDQDTVNIIETKYNIANI